MTSDPLPVKSVVYVRSNEVAGNRNFVGSLGVVLGPATPGFGRFADRDDIYSVYVAHHGEELFSRNELSHLGDITREWFDYYCDTCDGLCQDIF